MKVQEGNMIYSSVSCNVDNTLRKLETYQVDRMVDMEAIYLVTVTNKDLVQVDGDLYFDQDVRIELKDHIQVWAKELYGTAHPLMKQDGCGYYLIVPVRAYANYKIFCISYRKAPVFNDKDMHILSFLVGSVYESVLLDHDMMMEKNYLRNIFDSVASFIIGIDLDNRIVSVNKRGLDRFAKENDQMIGNDYRIYLSDVDRDKISGGVQYAIKKKRTFHFSEEVFSNLKKGRLYSDLTFSPLIETDGRVSGVVVVGTDKTKQKIYEREIEQLKQFSMLGELATGLAHDIKNPLTSIRGCSKILKKKMSGDPAILEFVEPIGEQVDRINHVINQMLSYAYITQKDNYSQIDVNDVLEKCTNIIRFHSKSKFIAIDTCYQAGLPLIQADNVQLQQAILNVMFNAIQAIDEKGRITIISRSLDDRKAVQIEIADDGQGIEADKVQSIFDPLYSTKSDGHGIGLSIVKRTIKKLNGEILVSSEVGVGTVLKITIPYGGKNEDA
jgi:PAS domain S-box-containing protein